MQMRASWRNNYSAKENIAQGMVVSITEYLFRYYSESGSWRKFYSVITGFSANPPAVLILDVKPWAWRLAVPANGRTKSWVGRTRIPMQRRSPGRRLPEHFSQRWSRLLSERSNFQRHPGRTPGSPVYARKSDSSGALTLAESADLHLVATSRHGTPATPA